MLNHVVDCMAARKPQALYAEYPVSATSYEEGFMKITYRKLANAVDRMAWWLVEHLGQGHHYETLAYFGPNDLRYPSLILGAVKAGYTTLLLSPRNSIEAQRYLLQTTACKVFLIPEPCPPPVMALMESLGEAVRVLRVPTVEQLLEPQFKQFMFDVSYQKGKHIPLTTLRTSGTTGLPKLITWTHEFVATWAKQFQLEPPLGYESIDQFYQANRVFVVFPPFHAAWVGHALLNAITKQTAVIFPLTGTIPTAQSLCEAIKHTRVDTALTVPVMIEEISRSPNLLESIAKNVDVIVYMGGDIPKGCGDVVAAHLPIINFYEFTEWGSFGLIRAQNEESREDWKYLIFHPKVSIEFRHHADDTYELVIVKDPEHAEQQQVFTIFRDLMEFPSRDLFRKHPTKSNLWSHCGRSDDTIVLLTGEKVTPVDMEQYILFNNPQISGVLVVGSKRFQTALLIEVTDQDIIEAQQQADLFDKFWPSINQANAIGPSHARIMKSHILIVDPKCPLLRSPKGTIQRSATIAQYAAEIDTLYEAADKLGSLYPASKCDVQDIKQALQTIQDCIKRVTGHNLNTDDNMFDDGIDSLQSLNIIRELRHTFSVPGITTGILYAHPNMSSFISTLQQMDKGISASTTTVDLISGRSSSQPDTPPSKVYLLTGSTGSLGSYILENLLHSDATHVYCLNRSSDSGILQKERNATKGLTTNLPMNKVTFLTADMSESTFGLKPEMYNTLLSSVTHIVHNAWPVDFNIPPSSFNKQLQGVVNLIKFATTTQSTSSLLFVSSVSATSHLVSNYIPELIIDDPSAAAPMGYGASKYIAERLLDYAARKLSLNIKIVRVGQIAGPLLGSAQWNRTEWLPSLIISSKAVSAVPESIGDTLDFIDWTPIDQVASIIIDLAECSVSDKAGKPINNGTVINGSGLQHKCSDAEVYNIVNPNTTQWQKLLPTIVATLSSIKSTLTLPINIVPLKDWINLIKQDFETQISSIHSTATKSTSSQINNSALQSVITQNPAAKLLTFYEEALNQKGLRRM